MSAKSRRASGPSRRTHCATVSPPASAIRLNDLPKVAPSSACSTRGTGKPHSSRKRRTYSSLRSDGQLAAVASLSTLLPDGKRNRKTRCSPAPSGSTTGTAPPYLSASCRTHSRTPGSRDGRFMRQPRGPVKGISNVRPHAKDVVVTFLGQLALLGAGVFQTADEHGQVEQDPALLGAADHALHPDDRDQP